MYFVVYVNQQLNSGVPQKGTAAYERWERRQAKKRKKKADKKGGKRR